MFTHRTKLRVRYAETDQMGVVYYANYLVWMEVARVEFCEAIGFRYRDMELGDGILLAVAESHCRYLNAARFDDEVTVVSSLSEANHRFVTFDYEMSAAGKKVATGSTRHIFLTREFRPVKLPAKYQSLFGAVMQV